jgi:pentatricopeptide repeat protein
MLKHGPLVPSLKAYEVLMKSLSKAENWKEVAHVYTDLVKRYSTEGNRREEDIAV